MNQRGGPHPEDFCQKCKGRNVVWFAPNALWNRVVGDNKYGILCPICFIKLAELKGVSRDAWKIQPESAVRKEVEVAAKAARDAALEEAAHRAYETPFRCHSEDDRDFHSGCVQTRDLIVDAIRALKLGN